MNVHIPVEQQSSRVPRAGYRLLSVLSSAAAAVVVSIVASIAGASMEVTSPLVGTIPINALLVALTAIPLALAAWGLLAILERKARQPRKIWTITAVVVLVLSLLPLPFLDANVGTKVALAAMHLATGLVLLLALPRGSRPTRGR